MSKKRKYLMSLLDFVKYYNTMTPFPYFDSEYLEAIKEEVSSMEEDIDYDQEPVVACKVCNSLHIITDEFDNDYCVRCGSVNQLEEFSNIDEFLKEEERRKNG